MSCWNRSRTTCAPNALWPPARSALYVDHARRFLAGRDAEGWAGVTSGEVTRAVLERSCAVSVSTAQNFVAALRALLRFGFVHGHMAADLSPTALAVTGRRRSTLPLGITHAQARAILAGCDRRRAGAATTRSSCCCCGWACAGRRWPA